MVAVIFDLDDTLVDSSRLLALRKQRKWKDCVRQLEKTYVFDGVHETISRLRESGIAMGVVTSSVSFYATALMRHHKLDVSAMIAYHDCSPRKPSPAPVLMCLSNRLSLQSPYERVVGVGDTEGDAIAYREAGIVAIGAGWSPATNREADWDKILESPTQLIDLF